MWKKGSTSLLNKGDIGVWAYISKFVTSVRPHSQLHLEHTHRNNDHNNYNDDY